MQLSNSHFFISVLPAFAYFFISVLPAFAYLDPGAGSMLFSAILGIISTVFFLFKGFFYKVVSIFYRLIGRKVKQQSTQIAIYSEGMQYQSTFLPIIAELEKQGKQILYLTSDERELILKNHHKNLEVIYIGKGNKAYAHLNFLEAKICLLTTTGLDVLQIKRSKGVKHYCHVIHSPGDIMLYKLFSFDYYDSVLTSGPHQIKALKYLEDLRQTPKKILLESGCSYYDILTRKYESYKEQSPPALLPKNFTNTQPVVLIAPSWGDNSLIKRYGSRLIKPLLDNNFKVIIRAHPQSYISEKTLLDNLKIELQVYTNIEWDNNPDNFFAMNQSDLMISDFSGIIYDFAFVFEKPIITIKFDFDLSITEMSSFAYTTWDLEMLDKVGLVVQESELNLLGQKISTFLENNTAKENIQKLREKYVYNFANAAPVATKQILQILEQQA